MLRLHSSVLGVRTAEQPISLPTQSGERFEVPKGDVLVIANMCVLALSVSALIGQGLALRRRALSGPDVVPSPSIRALRRLIHDTAAHPPVRRRRGHGAWLALAVIYPTPAQCKGRVFAIFNELWTVILALEMFDLEFVSLELTPGRKMVDGAGATLTVPGEVPGRAGAAVGMPDDGFVLNLRLRR